jgi:hypothetical protein
VITLDGYPKNNEKFGRLLTYLKEILDICRSMGVEPIVDGSLAVFAYTKNQDIVVNDIDLGCFEEAFPRIAVVLDDRRTKYRLREWHVLQVLKDDLRIELGSIEYWYRDLPIQCGTLQIGDRTVKMLGLGSLKALYKRGLDYTASNLDEGNNRLKHESYCVKYDALNAIDPESDR